MGLVPGSGRSHGGGNSNLLQYSCLGNPMDKGDQWALQDLWGCQELDTTEVTQHTCKNAFKPVFLTKTPLKGPVVGTG